MSAGNNTTTLTVIFDEKVMSLIAVKKAAHRHLRAFTTDISVLGGQIQCLLTFPSPISEEDRVRIGNEFKKEVLDQELREQLRVETTAVRNVILAHAFSKTGLTTDEPVSGR